MKKLLLFILTIPLLLVSCIKKEPPSTEYFSFYANGKEYNYPQGKSKGSLFVGSSDAIAAWFHDDNLVVATIYAFSLEDPVTYGEFRFWLSEKNLPSQDTIILGAKENFVTINKFLYDGANYRTRYPQSGKMIFTERTSKRLTGIFEFDAVNIHDDTTVIHITNGKFSIIP